MLQIQCGKNTSYRATIQAVFLGFSKGDRHSEIDSKPTLPTIGVLASPAIPQTTRNGSQQAQATEQNVPQQFCRNSLTIFTVRKLRFPVHEICREGGRAQHLNLDVQRRFGVGELQFEFCLSAGRSIWQVHLLSLDRDVALAEEETSQLVASAHPSRADRRSANTRRLRDSRPAELLPATCAVPRRFANHYLEHLCHTNDSAYRDFRGQYGIAIRRIGSRLL